MGYLEGIWEMSAGCGPEEECPWPVQQNSKEATVAGRDDHREESRAVG